jgi:hypothetical protein
MRVPEKSAEAVVVRKALQWGWSEGPKKSQNGARGGTGPFAEREQDTEGQGCLSGKLEGESRGAPSLRTADGGAVEPTLARRRRIPRREACGTPDRKR